MAYDPTEKHVYNDPNAPGISTDDVATCLGVSSGDVETLCKSSAVKRWPKNKPVRSHATGILSSADRRALLWGLGVPTEREGAAATMAGQQSAFMAAAQDTGGNAFEYLRPRGSLVTPSEGCRLADFDGYRHVDTQPVQTFAMAAINIASISGNTVTFRLVKSADADGFINLADLVSALGIGGYYVAIGFMRGTSFFYRTSTVTLASWAAHDTQYQIEVSFNTTDTPFYNVPTAGITEQFYVCAAAERYAAADTTIPSDQVFIPLPFNVKSEGYGSVSVSNNLPVAFEMKRIGTISPSASMHFNDYSQADNYLLPPSSGGLYYELPRTGNFAFGIKMTNNSGASLTLLPNRIKMESSLNAVDWSSGTGQATASSIFYATSESGLLIDGSGGIDIAAGASVYVILYGANFFRRPYTSGIIDEGSGRARFTLYYDDIDCWDNAWLNIQHND